MVPVFISSSKCLHGSWGLLPMRLRRKRQWKLRIWLGYRYHWWHQIWFLEEWTKLLVSSSLRSICFGSSINQFPQVCPWFLRLAANAVAPQAPMEASHLTRIPLLLMTSNLVSCSMDYKLLVSSSLRSICFGSSINQFLQVCPHGSSGLLPMRMRWKHQWKLRIWLRYHYCWWHQIWFLAVWIISFLWAQA